MDGSSDLGPLTLDRLTRDVWVYQRARGHRFSSDDLVTARVAALAAPVAATVADLGCGLGSVLLHLAWSLPAARLVGVEVQASSFALVEKNVAHNRLGDRVQVHHGDLRDAEVLARLGGPFALVTGTPPYFPPGAALDARDGQRARARIEHAGGVEAYAAAAGCLLADDGVAVICGAGGAHERMVAGATSAGLAVRARVDVHPRAGAAPLFAVWTLRRSPGELSVTSMTLRDAAGAPTADAAALREFAGLA